MSFLTYEKVDLVKQVIALSENYRVIREELKPESETGSLGEVYKFYETENGKKIESEKNKLKDFLMSRSYEEVQFLQTVMYVGRDPEEGDDTMLPEELYRVVFSNLPWASKEAEVKQMVEKGPLGDYLESGLKLLNR